MGKDIHGWWIRLDPIWKSCPTRAPCDIDVVAGDGDGGGDVVAGDKDDDDDVAGLHQVN